MDFTFDRGNDRPALFPRSGQLSGKCGEVGRDRMFLQKMKTHTANGKGGCGAQSRTAVYRAIDWLENYISKNPSSDAAIEAGNIIRELQGLRLRAGVDELLALLGQIAKSGGLQEIDRAKIRMSQPAETTDERHQTKRSAISVGEKR